MEPRYRRLEVVGRMTHYGPHSAPRVARIHVSGVFSCSHNNRLYVPMYLHILGKVSKRYTQEACKGPFRVGFTGVCTNDHGPQAKQ